MNGTNVLPVVKLTNVTYDSSVAPGKRGQYAILLINASSDNPSVPQINSLLFPNYEDTVLEDNKFGVENVLEDDLFSNINVTSTSQLVVVGEYNEPVNVSGASSGVANDVLIEMQAGFAEEYFV